MISRAIASVVALALILATSCVAEISVSDSFRNELSVKLPPGESSSTISVTDSLSYINNYILDVFIYNGNRPENSPPSIPNTVQEFWFDTGLFANATLVWSAYSSSYIVSGLQRNTTSDQYVGSSAHHNTAPGLYRFNFSIPVGGVLNTTLTYRTSFTAQGVPMYFSMDHVSIVIVNPRNLPVYTEKIVDDMFNNSVNLIMENGVHSSSIVGSAILPDNGDARSNYFVNVYIRNGEMFMVTKPEDVYPNTQESWEYGQQNFGDAFKGATQYTSLQNGVLFTSYTPVGPPWVTMHVGPINSWMTTVWFYIPPGGQLRFSLTYRVEWDRIQTTNNVDVLFTNLRRASGGVIGDPQFTGLRGQSFQVHGIDGAVYNLITDTNTQVNAQFVFLDAGVCPASGHVITQCWSHPGSYLGSVAFQQRVDGNVHQLIVKAGSAETGFDSIMLNGQSLKQNASLDFRSLFSVSYRSSHQVFVTTEHFQFELTNSDMFINQVVSSRVPLINLHSHGLLGQTHVVKSYPTALKHIVGEVDDYAVADNDLFGYVFAYNRFQQ